VRAALRPRQQAALLVVSGRDFLIPCALVEFSYRSAL
jgi:hypothetical protein